MCLDKSLHKVFPNERELGSNYLKYCKVTWKFFRPKFSCNVVTSLKLKDL